LVSEILECTDFEFPALDSKWQPFGGEPNALARQQVIEDKTVDNTQKLDLQTFDQ
jgi:hypothetical protein